MKAIFRMGDSFAYSAFEALSQQGIASINDVEWRKIIGMRNTLVHDYLNIESEIIKTVIKNKVYCELLSFAGNGLIALGNISRNE